MKQGGYLLIEIVAIALLTVVLSITLFDLIRTRQQRKLADEQLKRAQEEVFEDMVASEKKARPSNIDEMRILRDIVLPREISGALVRPSHVSTPPSGRLDLTKTLAIRSACYRKPPGSEADSFLE